ncbi:MAG: hypothetical protein AAF171_10465 [Cyanobacteria bacterium P01_A01_bin.116]
MAKIDLIIYRLIARELEAEAFEQWVYSENALESFLGPDNYLALMSLDYSLPSSLNEAEKICKPYIDIASYHEWSLRRVLQGVIDRPNDASNYIKQCYKLYCDGYGFLDNLGLGYGLAIAVSSSGLSSGPSSGLSSGLSSGPSSGPSCEGDAATGNALTSPAQKKLIDSFYPAICKEAEKVLHWLDVQKIVLTGHDGGAQGIQYSDNRTLKEKAPTAYEVAK